MYPYGTFGSPYMGGRAMGPLMNTRAELYQHEVASKGALYGGLGGAGLGLLAAATVLTGGWAAVAALALTGLGAAAGYTGGSATAQYNDTMDNGLRDGSPLVAEHGSEEYGPAINPYSAYAYGFNGMF